MILSNSTSTTRSFSSGPAGGQDSAKSGSRYTGEPCWLTSMKSPAGLLKFLVEGLQELGLGVDIERHVVFYCIKSSQNKVEEASLIRERNMSVRVW